MSQRDKARELVRELEFSLRTVANQEEIVSVLDSAAAAAAHGGLRGTIRRVGLQDRPGGFVTDWEIRGLGGIVKGMTFKVTGTGDAGGVTTLAMAIQNYFFTKGSMFSKPTINNDKEMRKFAHIVTSQLTAKPEETT